MLVRGKRSARGRFYPFFDQFRKLVSQLRTVTHLPGVCAGILLFYFLNLNHENPFVIVNEKKWHTFFNMSGPNIISVIFL
ncbi:Uncharacterised protein [Klebsiella variicola]|nr:Uncharacterised protein [Klebsiella variicola]